MKTVVNYINSAHDKIVNLPRVKQEPKTGHWIETHDDWGNGIITDRKYKCSVCHGKHIDPEMGEWHEVFDYKYPFCPNCGVKMAEPEESEENDRNPLLRWVRHWWASVCLWFKRRKTVA